eukprot:TRINITY_DN1202_c1_g1_i5.p1 TRINITY_DN1202_c1_g1~~TRINITY_DN1202_c1_g1_i5.p1  ORF type:complete len:862 (+),score=243.58 TRINITY_DN1202_c1_g1_i5:237-2822(+)
MASNADVVGGVMDPQADAVGSSSQRDDAASTQGSLAGRLQSEEAAVAALRQEIQQAAVFGSMLLEKNNKFEHQNAQLKASLEENDSEAGHRKRMLMWNAVHKMRSMANSGVTRSTSVRRGSCGSMVLPNETSRRPSVFSRASSGHLQELQEFDDEVTSMRDENKELEQMAMDLSSENYALESRVRCLTLESHTEECANNDANDEALEEQQMRQLDVSDELRQIIDELTARNWDLKNEKKKWETEALEEESRFQEEEVLAETYQEERDTYLAEEFALAQNMTDGMDSMSMDFMESQEGGAGAYSRQDSFDVSLGMLSIGGMVRTRHAVNRFLALRKGTPGAAATSHGVVSSSVVEAELRDLEKCLQSMVADSLLDAEKADGSGGPPLWTLSGHSELQLQDACQRAASARAKLSRIVLDSNGGSDVVRKQEELAAQQVEAIRTELRQEREDAGRSIQELSAKNKQHTEEIQGVLKQEADSRQRRIEALEVESQRLVAALAHEEKRREEDTAKTASDIIKRQREMDVEVAQANAVKLEMREIVGEVQDQTANLRAWLMSAGESTRRAELEIELERREATQLRHAFEHSRDELHAVRGELETSQQSLVSAGKQAELATAKVEDELHAVRGELETSQQSLLSAGKQAELATAKVEDELHAVRGELETSQQSLVSAGKQAELATAKVEDELHAVRGELETSQQSLVSAGKQAELATAKVEETAGLRESQQEAMKELEKQLADAMEKCVGYRAELRTHEKDTERTEIVCAKREQEEMEEAKRRMEHMKEDAVAEHDKLSHEAHDADVRRLEMGRQINDMQNEVKWMKKEMAQQRDRDAKRFAEERQELLRTILDLQTKLDAATATAGT